VVRGEDAAEDAEEAAGSMAPPRNQRRRLVLLPDPHSQARLPPVLLAPITTIVLRTREKNKTLR